MGGGGIDREAEEESEEWEGVRGGRGSGSGGGGVAEMTEMTEDGGGAVSGASKRVWAASGGKMKAAASSRAAFEAEMSELVRDGGARVWMMWIGGDEGG